MCGLPKSYEPPSYDVDLGHKSVRRKLARSVFDDSFGKKSAPLRCPKIIKAFGEHFYDLFLCHKRGA